MLRVQRLVPRIPPRLLGAARSALLGAKRFVDWSFGHYLRIAPPEFALASANDQNGAGEKQADAEDPLGAERDLVEAEQASGRSHRAQLPGDRRAATPPRRSPTRRSARWHVDRAEQPPSR